MVFPYVLIKGAGDLASGVALVLKKAGYPVVMTEIPQPTCVRRKVSFADMVYQDSICIEGTWGRLVDDFSQAREVADRGEIPVLVDPEGKTLKNYRPEIFIDAAMAKKNLGTNLDDAGTVIALGPGFHAGRDVHAVIETQRGNRLGEPIFSGTAIPNTGIPGEVKGYAIERLLRAPAGGIFRNRLEIGDLVEKGDIVGYVDDAPVKAEIPGVVRGLLKSGLPAYPGLKVGDIHPEKRPDLCFRVTDKAWQIGWGVLRAIWKLQGISGEKKRERDLQIFSQIEELLGQGNSGVLYTLIDAGATHELESGARLLVMADGRKFGSLRIPALDRDMLSRSNDILAHGQEGTIIDWQVPWTEMGKTDGDGVIKIFAERISPQKKLIIFGGGHVALPLAEMAAILEFRVIVVDDRPEFANEERFPRAGKIICASFEDVFQKKLLEKEIDAVTSIVIITRGHSQDRTCVRHLAATPVNYIGMIGSIQKVKQTFRALLEEGIPREALERISAPVGLDLGGQRPAEIALSILAEIVAGENKGTGRPVHEIRGGVF
ncbi:selenium-dependent molybdenum cofactor biosynthesis protein YqeB [Candidatus Formimonas warabiya]|uniref:XdhC Rossmann domain-containing protein n=1 Tax=Formimonas warabiya TaxID=1761012 RepID=A0A3G1KQY7_FORW1|nr:selenium-dependent molybdenum cofactor biosynthesis protein YqeB [Candidatus Formimonas warabiya]ATW24892.1 hypothetical protein DCMF_09020 [Candidatus Formimonas warabiya]